MSASVRAEPIPHTRPVNAGRTLLRTAKETLAAGKDPARALGRFAVTSTGLRILVSLALVGGFLAFIHGAEAHLKGMDAFQVDPRCMKIREMPPWLAPNWTKTIENPFAGGAGANLFEPGLVQKVRKAYQASPWIEGVTLVRKEFPDRLMVRLRIRTPLAAVPWGDKLLLVDGHGVLMPKKYDKLPDFGFPLRRIEGVTSAPPEAGEVWESKALRAGLRVAAVLTASKKKSLERITRIDVSLVGDRPGRGRTEILLFAAEGGGPIEWGTVLAGPRGLEIDEAKKVDNLERLLSACRDMRRVKYALVQFDEVVYSPVK